MSNQKNALVCGAGGFIGGHLVQYLKEQGYWVRGVDIKEHEYRTTAADEFLVCDLRKPEHCADALRRNGCGFDEVYQLAADMGGMGFIHSAECEIMRNNALINIGMIHAATQAGVKRYFFSSSVCVYRDMKIGEPELCEDQAYPASPDNEYGWEKLYSERMVMKYGQLHEIETRIARFQNCYGPYGTWTGGREKAPAAICRKVAEVTGDEGEIEVWGDGTAVRSYTFVDDMTDGIYRLMQSDIRGAVNIGNPEYVTVTELVNAVMEVAQKNIHAISVEGPVGVQSRNFSNAKIYTTGWNAKISLVSGLRKTYPWVSQQVELAAEPV